MNKFYEIIKKTIPKPIYDILGILKDNLLINSLTNYDRKRYKKYYSSNYNHSNINQINARLIYYSHAIEKGLSHEDIRLGFGKNILKSLADLLKLYENNKFDKSELVYQNAISVINEYVTLHQNNNYDISYVKNLFHDFIDEIINAKSEIGGSKIIYKIDKKNNDTKNFLELFNNRFSIRTYSDEPVDIENIKKSINISTKSPSVCNRQSSRVYVVTNKKIIIETLKIQAGLNNYTPPPALLVVTSNSSSSLSPQERNQSYIDGGVFSMSLLLSLEFQKLAACPLNAAFNISRDKSIRKLLSISDSENIIMLIAVGNFNESSKVAKSFRLTVDDITKVIK
ncbi:MAG: nitroreductase family protein [Candidatus Gastranaerophilales bacterium]|nr:nitroreductase family protein [Candidatus Gastranaerophilales bacterium]